MQTNQVSEFKRIMQVNSRPTKHVAGSGIETQTDLMKVVAAKIATF
jgi:hypothetical protein